MTTATPRPPQPLRRETSAILAALLALAAAGWAAMAWQSSVDEGMPDGGMGPDLTMGMTAPLFLAMWVAMMVAMMFPAAAPMILMFARSQAHRRANGRPYVPTTLFAGAYLALWSAFGAVAYGVAVGVNELAARSELVMDHWARGAGVLLVAAGAYQLTPLKDVCLSRCRTPLSFVLEHWRDGRRGALVMGIKHGGYCLGCCWLLFVILVPLGVMNLVAMVAVTALVFVEKVAPPGAGLGRLAGVVLVAYGAAVLVSPGLLPTA